MKRYFSIILMTFVLISCVSNEEKENAREIADQVEKVNRQTTKFIQDFMNSANTLVLHINFDPNYKFDSVPLRKLLTISKEKTDSALLKLELVNDPYEKIGYTQSYIKYLETVKETLEAFDLFLINLDKSRDIDFLIDSYNMVIEKLKLMKKDGNTYQVAADKFYSKFNLKNSPHNKK